MEQGTFSHQSHLPSLPLPKLEDTIGKYLHSLIPVVKSDELTDVTNLSKNFIESDDAKKIQSFLEKRAKNRRNWLESWWYQAYNSTRCPLLFQNMGAINPRATPHKKQQLHVAAQFIHEMMNYWQLIRKEKIEIMQSRGVKWDMSQVYNLFNACRQPQVPCDVLKRHFRTEKEGPCPTHVIIFCKGHVWEFDTMSKGQIKSADEIFQVLTFIESKSAKRCENSILPLTTLDRNSWADLMKYALFGLPNNAYADKNLNVIVMKNGQICQQADHCNVDAISLFAPCDHAAKKLDYNWTPELMEISYPPTELVFDLTKNVEEQIVRAEECFKQTASHIELNVFTYYGYGHKLCRKFNLYTDTVVQIALQMAYYNTHGRCAPTYETASTRMFFHGRTETVRSLTPTLAKFLKACDNAATPEALCTFFYEAYNSHNALMDSARRGQGIDRHFLGIQKARELLQTSSIPLFEHPSFEMSGGNGNFKLSTSFLGYDEEGCFGYVTAMCNNGYGAFYKIASDRLIFTLTTFKNETTNLTTFTANLEKSLSFIMTNIILQTNAH
ncbi:unnamed protein product [Caenorhabditis bovis]|uniref:Choline/carnitine acyltransferase domain-containing protein n=1 Tax=Caenorhabditis bovis TaxID=2654633 RepID=A0A8S1E7Q9_9PELO|nr:unnamed protein product [Caenorhabditis bovis]